MKVNTEKLSVSNERLSIIGRLIGIYREERRDNSQNSWTQKRFCKDICSPNTLKNIEAGGLSRSIEIYVEMLNKFDLKLGEFPEIDKAVYRLTEELYEAIEFFSIESITKITDKILRILEKVNKYAYYSELYDLFIAIKVHYEEDIFINGCSCERYNNIRHFMPSDFEDMFKLLIYAKLKSSSISNKEEYAIAINDLALEKSKNNFIKLILLDYYYICGKYLRMKNLISELEVLFKEEYNIIRLYDMYEGAIVLLSKIEFEKCLCYIEKAKELMNNKGIPSYKIAEMNSNIAIAYQINENYKEALYYYNKMVEENCINHIDSYIFMADCQNHLNLPINIPIVNEEAYNQYPYDLKIMYKYFIFDESVPAFAKETYILKRIAPVLTDADYIKVFRFELLRLVNITLHYKSIHTFESKVSNNLKVT